jgi:hypothetical protein
MDLPMDIEEYREQAVEELRHQAAGGWRRAVTGLLVGTGLGAMIVVLTRRDPTA